MEIQLIRHATLIISVNNKRILIDPILSKAGTISPVQNVPNQNYNPLVDLPIDIDSIINCDAVIVTHTHRDHFDDAAAKLLPKNIPILCQPQDKLTFQSFGFTDVNPISETFTWHDITFTRIDGVHGHDELALKMAPVSGFVITCSKEPSVYIAGDTVWCTAACECVDNFKPKIMICNCGSAQFEYGRPITMSTDDLNEIISRYANLNIVAVHMDAWNHCRLSRKELQHYIISNNIKNKIMIPEDGEIIKFNAYSQPS